MDRNFDTVQIVVVIVQSLSARRAWIEIKSGLHPLMASLTSLSARRAWIEILAYPDMIICTNVALRKESVDRNYIIKITVCRPAASLSARRAWIEI